MFPGVFLNLSEGVLGFAFLCRAVILSGRMGGKYRKKGTGSWWKRYSMELLLVAALLCFAGAVLIHGQLIYGVGVCVVWMGVVYRRQMKRGSRAGVPLREGNHEEPAMVARRIMNGTDYGALSQDVQRYMESPDGDGR